MENKFISFVNKDDLECMIDVSKITDVQLFQRRKEYNLCYDLCGALEFESFDSLEEADHKFNRIKALTKGREIGVDNTEEEGILKILVVPQNFKRIILKLNKDKDKDEDHYGKWFIHYFAQIYKSPFEKNCSVPEMFNSEQEAREVFASLKKELCFGGLDVIEGGE